MRRIALLTAMAALVGCGGSAATSTPTPDGGDAAATPEAPPATPDAPEDVPPPPETPPFGANIGPVTTCDTSKPFGAVVPIQGFTHEQDAFTFSNDLLTIYVTSGGHSGNDAFDLFTATRPSLTQPFGTRVHIDQTGGGDDRYPILSHDELTLYYVWQTESVRFLRRTTKTGPFETIGSLDNLSFADRVWISQDGKRIYFSGQAQDGTSTTDLYVGDLANDAVTNRRALTSLNGASNESGPLLTSDELTLYFTSNRPAGVGDGLTDIFVARRAKTSDAFGAPQKVVELSTDVPDTLLWLSPEGCTAYLRRQMGGDLTFHVASRGM